MLEPALASSLLWSPVVTAPAAHLDAAFPHVFVTGSDRALALLRRAVRGVPTVFLCHLPIDGEACLGALERPHRPVMWLSDWAVAHAELVVARLRGARFVVIDGAGVGRPLPGRCECLRLSEGGLEVEPERQVARLLDFLAAADESMH